MKSAILALSLLLACGAAAAKISPEKMAVVGEWTGRGETVGNAFTACAVFAPYMDDIYLHLDFSTRYDAIGALPDIESEYFYYFLDDARIEGVSLDNQSNVFQLSGSHDGATATLQWLKNGKIVGQSEWHLSKDGKTLTFTRFGLLPNGELKEIGDVLLQKLPAGESCRK